MAIDFEKYRIINKTNNNVTKKEVQITNVQNMISKSFEDNINCEDVFINDINTKVLILNESSLNQNPSKKVIIRKPKEKLFVGDNIKWKNTSWLCTAIELNDTVYCKGIIQKCNQILKFYNSSSLLIQIPCISTNQTLYSLGTDETRVMTLGDSKLSLILPNNSETVKIKRDKVFIVDDMVWKVTNIDKQNEGLIKLICTEIVERIGDDLVNGIPLNENLPIVIEFIDDIYTKTLYDSFTLKPIIKQGDSVLNAELIYTSSNINIASVDNTGHVNIGGTGNCIITCCLKENQNIQSTITIVANSQLVEDKKYIVTGSDILKKNNTNTYTANKVVNGEIVECNFSIHTQNFIGLDSSMITFTIVNNNSCKVKSNLTEGSFDILFRDNNETSNYVIKTVHLKNLYGN